MSMEANKELIRRWFEVEWSRPDTVDWVGTYCDSGIALHVGQAEIAGVDGVKEMVRGLKTAFPDIRITVEKLLAEGDLVAYHHQAKGTHLGPFAGHPATGRSFVMRVTGILRVVGGKSVEGWENWDEPGLLRQLGLAP